MSKAVDNGLRVSEIRGQGVIKRDVSSSPGQNTQATDARSVVLEIVTEMSPSAPTELRPDTELVGELGFDSLGIVELLVVLEDTLDLPPLNAEVLGGMERVSDLEQVVSEAQARMPQGETV